MIGYMYNLINPNNRFVDEMSQTNKEFSLY